MMFTISRSNSTTQTNKNDSMQVSFAIINHMLVLLLCNIEQYYADNEL